MRILFLTLSLAMAGASASGEPTKPLVIAHRGASGYLPEHTLAAYRRAIEMGANFIEPDLVITKDGVLVARHENEIGGTTDVAQRKEFASRRTTKLIDGESVAGWFAEDFTLAELKTLRARERIPHLRPASARHDGRYEVPTFDEVLALLAEVNRGRARPVGVYPETKHPSHFRSIGLPLEEPLVAALDRHGLRGRDAPVFLQSFEVGSLQRLSRMIDVPLVQLLDEGAQWDFAAIARYARGVGPHKRLVTRAFVAHAHAAGLVVHPWTFRAENHFLPEALRRGADPATHGDLAGEVAHFAALGVDGIFTDHPDLARAAR